MVFLNGATLRNPDKIYLDLSPRTTTHIYSHGEILIKIHVQSWDQTKVYYHLNAILNVLRGVRGPSKITNAIAKCHGKYSANSGPLIMSW